MKIVAEVFKLPSGSLIPQLYCLNENGEVVRDVTDTLLDLIAESIPNETEKLASLLQAVENGTYKRSDLLLPDWSANDKYVWIGPPKTDIGHVLISNENIPDYSMEDGGEPQKFSMNQLRAAMEHWRQFVEIMRSKGKENLVGERFEGMI